MTQPIAAEADLAIVGAGGHGFVVAEAAQAQRRWQSITFYDDRAETGSVGPFELQGSLDALRARALTPNAPEVIVAIGRNNLRLKLSEEFLGLGLHLATVIHPSAVLSPSCHVGAGSVVLAGAIINARSRIGRACILNTRCSVDHDNQLADGVHISPGASLAGGVSVGTCSWIGIGAAVIQGILIGSHARIGAGSAVIREIPDHATAVGCPAVIRHRI